MCTEDCSSNLPGGKHSIVLCTSRWATKVYQRRLSLFKPSIFTQWVRAYGPEQPSAAMRKPLGSETTSQWPFWSLYSHLPQKCNAARQNDGTWRRLVSTVEGVRFGGISFGGLSRDATKGAVYNVRRLPRSTGLRLWIRDSRLVSWREKHSILSAIRIVASESVVILYAYKLACGLERGRSRWEWGCDVYARSTSKQAA